MKLNYYLFVIVFFLSFSTLPTNITAQSDAASTYKDIKKFGVLASVLYVAAHPDDENTRLISYLSNHLSAHTTYLSLTRGDGGQNLIGSEIREMLGVIRTHELLEARRIDGGSQLFSRANDFGYSKTAAETFNIWNREEVLSDVVWAIRTMQPDVIINRFNTDITRPNHGHHTASAILSLEAFDLAANPKLFSSQLSLTDTWQPRRIFFNTSWFFYGSKENFDKVDKSKMVGIDIGAFDNITGESNSEIAARSRSMHKSQGFGSAETRGESMDYLDLLKDSGGTIPKHIFDGIDITWNRISGGAAIARKSELLKKNYNFKDPAASVSLLLEIYEDIKLLDDSFWKNKKLDECEALIKNCLGLFIEVRGSVFRTSPEMIIPVTLEVINRSQINVKLKSIALPDNASISLDTDLAYNQVYLKDIQLTIPDKLSTPYWLKELSSEGMYKVPEQKLRGLPADPHALMTSISCDVAGHSLSFDLPVQYRIIDPAEGEIYRPIMITPPVTIDKDADVLLFPKGESRVFNMTLTAIQDSVSGTLNLAIAQPGWQVIPKEIEWSFSRPGESIAVAFTITAPAFASTGTLIPEIKSGEKSFHHSVATIDYSHLPYLSVVRDASLNLQSFDIKITPRNIAYIDGAGDDVAESIEQLGYDIDVVDPIDISATNLKNYQVVILGIRAFNTIESLTYKNKLLFDWVHAGGTLIVQYNTNRGLVTEDIAPYPLTLSRDRITEEVAPVTILAKDHAVMNFPNKIDHSDFANWVQERGLYFPNAWNENFVSILEMNDTSEIPTKGALLIAPYGEGHYVYTGLSLFRHLPAGVPGAYRLLSNLISLGYKQSKS